MPAIAAVPPPPDRYADAVRARRAELRAARDDLSGGHRAELRSALALARLAAEEELSTAVRSLAGQVRDHLEAAGRRDRARFGVALLGAVEELRRWAADRRNAHVRSAARRVASRRGVRVDRAWPPAPEPPGPFRAPRPEPAAPRWAPIAGGWRTALLPAASLPLVGLPVASPPAVLATAAVGVAVAVTVGGHQVASADRLRLRRWSEDVLAAVRTDGDAALARLLIHIEQATGELDAAVTLRRAQVEAELASLAPAPLAEAPGLPGRAEGGRIDG